MSIRIYNDGMAGAAAAEASRAQDVSRPTSSGKAAEGIASLGGDHVEISSLSASVASQSSQRSARVQELAAMYQSGRYEVNSMDVSRAIVNNALSAGATGSEA